MDNELEDYCDDDFSRNSSCLQLLVLRSTPIAPTTTSTHGFRILIFVYHVALEEIEWIALQLVRICLRLMVSLKRDVILEWRANGVASISTQPRLLALVNEHGKISAINFDCLFRCLTRQCDVQGRMIGSQFA